MKERRDEERTGGRKVGTDVRKKTKEGNIVNKEPFAKQQRSPLLQSSVQPAELSVQEWALQSD